jgi:hypothetical protein
MRWHTKRNVQTKRTLIAAKEKDAFQSHHLNDSFRGRYAPQAPG